MSEGGVLIRAVPGSCGGCMYWFQTDEIERAVDEEEGSGSGQVVELSKKRQRKTETVELGECRWRPPAPDGDGGHGWPLMEETEWCGQFEEAVYLEFDETTPAEEEKSDG
jgi:hypothetical protein